MMKSFTVPSGQSRRSVGSEPLALMRESFVKPCQPLHPVVKVDRPPVIGVDQAEVPQLASLVDVGHTGCGQFERHLR